MKAGLSQFWLAVRQGFGLLLRFLRWWRNELVGMVPVAWRLRLGLEKPVLAISRRADLVDVVLVSAGQVRKICQGASVAAAQHALDELRPAIAAKKLHGTLLLDPEDILTRRLTLPSAASARLAEVMAFELPRQTPFSIDDAYYDWQSIEASESGVVINLAAAERSRIDVELQAARELGVEAATADISGSDGGPTGFDLLRHTRGGAGFRWRDNVGKAFACVVLILFVVMAHVEVGKQEAVLAALNADLVRVRREALAVEALRKDLEQTRGRQAFIAGQTKDRQVAAALLRLSRELPDTVWLQQLQLHGRDLRLSGYAPDTAAVINIMENSGFFENAQFRAPSIRRNADMDRFDISVSIGKGDGP